MFGILPIHAPFGWIPDDILSHPIQFDLTPDDVLVKAALPGKIGHSRRPDQPGGCCLEGSHNLPKRCVLVAIREHNHAVHVIRHQHVGIQFQPRKTVRQAIPDGLNDLTSGGEIDTVVNHVRQQTLFVLDADGDKVGAGAAVIVVAEAYGVAIVVLPVPSCPVTMIRRRSLGIAEGWLRRSEKEKGR